MDAGPGDSGIPPIDGGPPFSGPKVTGTVTVGRSTTAGQLGPAFVGLSFEKSHITNGSFTASNAPLIALLKLLGPGVLRLGANDGDKEIWNPTAAAGGPSSPFPTEVGTADVDAFAAFVNASGWKVLYTLNFKNGLNSSMVTPANDAAEAQYVASKLGTNLMGFEIGNEIDFVGSWASLKPKWESIAAAVLAKVPNAQFAGPAAFGQVTTFTAPFAADEASKLFLVTQHYYRNSSNSASATMAQLLSPDPGLVSLVGSLSTIVTSNHISSAYRMAECNSFSSHGKAGVSDALASALWSLDFMFTNALHGATGINFHGGQVGMDGTKPFLYSPIQEAGGAVTGAAPLFYGMAMMSMVGTGKLYPTTAAAGGLEFTAYSVGAADGSTAIVLDNKDATSGVEASIDIGGAVTSADVIYLQGSALSATTGITLAGASISPAGVFTPHAPYAATVSGTHVTVLVPPASAALVRAR